MKSRVSTLILILFVACLSQISIDIYLPSLPAIAHDWGISNHLVQMTLSIFLLGTAISQWFYGPISEGVGRTRPLLGGLTIALAGTLICLSANNITLLLVGRFIQGAGTGAGVCLWRAVFRDLYQGDESRVVIAYITMILTWILPVIPIVGGYLQQHFGWHASFFFMTIYTLVALALITYGFKETGQYHHPERLKRRFIISTFNSLFRHRKFMGNSFCCFFSIGAYFAWFAVAPILLISHLHLSPSHYGWVTALYGGIAIGLSGLISSRIIKHVSSQSLLRMGWTLALIAALLLLWIPHHWGISVTTVMIPISLMYFGLTFIWPQTFTGAFESVGHISGYAGTLYSFLQIAGGALFSAIAAHFPATTPYPLAYCMIACIVIAWIIFETIANPAAHINVK